jgi:hypothetical protein
MRRRITTASRVRTGRVMDQAARFVCNERRALDFINSNRRPTWLCLGNRSCGSSGCARLACRWTHPELTRVNHPFTLHPSSAPGVELVAHSLAVLGFHA